MLHSEVTSHYSTANVQSSCCKKHMFDATLRHRQDVYMSVSNEITAMTTRYQARRSHADGMIESIKQTTVT